MLQLALSVGLAAHSRARTRIACARTPAGRTGVGEGEAGVRLGGSVEGADEEAQPGFQRSFQLLALLQLLFPPLPHHHDVARRVSAEPEQA